MRNNNFAPTKQSIDKQLQLFKDELRERAYPYYPPQEQRLFTPYDELERTESGRIIIPQGPWDVDNHPKNKRRERSPNASEQQQLLKNGYELDSEGRPLHPWLHKMLGDKAIGAVFGKGTYRNWGANETADPIVVVKDHVAIIKRKDTETFALPGGHLEKNEDPRRAALREFEEETGRKIPKATAGTKIYEGPVVDLRMASAWPITYAYLLEPDIDHLPKIKGQDDAKEAKWVPINEALDLRMFGSHRYLLELALKSRTR